MVHSPSLLSLKAVDSLSVELVDIVIDQSSHFSGEAMIIMTLTDSRSLISSALNTGSNQWNMHARRTVALFGTRRDATADI